MTAKRFLLLLSVGGITLSRCFPSLKGRVRAHARAQARAREVGNLDNNFMDEFPHLSGLKITSSLEGIQVVAANWLSYTPEAEIMRFNTRVREALGFNTMISNVRDARESRDWHGWVS